MQRLERIRNLNLLPYLLIFYSVGVVGLILEPSRELFKALVPLNLLLNLFLLLLFHRGLNLSLLWKGLLIFSAGVLVEVIGVNTGVIFGSYSYGPTLGPKLFHTPLIIGVNWFMLVYMSLLISGRFFEQRYFRILLAAIMMVVYDFMLEPAAIDLDMWSWGGPVPMQNYLAWLLISLVLLWFADVSKLIDKGNKMAAPLFFVQFGFFMALDLWMLISGIWEL